MLNRQIIVEVADEFGGRSVYAVEWPETCLLSLSDIRPIAKNLHEVWDIADCGYCDYYQKTCSSLSSRRRKVVKVGYHANQEHRGVSSNGQES